MSPNRLTAPLRREVPSLRLDQDLGSAVRDLLSSGLPALPVVDDAGRPRGIFGEREFFTALFPGYLQEMRSLRFVPRSLDEWLEQRGECRLDPVRAHMNEEEIAVGPDASDVQIAETFMHHRVLLLPVVSDGRLVGAITRSDFFRMLGERFLDVNGG